MTRLTPADVHNVVFSKPPFGARGYHQDQVDSFLDDVEETLRDLYDRLARYESAQQGEPSPGSGQLDDRGYRSF